MTTEELRKYLQTETIRLNDRIKDCPEPPFIEGKLEAYSLILGKSATEFLESKGIHYHAEVKGSYDMRCVNLFRIRLLLEEFASKSSKESDAVQFAEWKYKNRWFDFNTKENKWCYTFEGGTSISEEAYSNNYMKTTQQLYELFKTESKK